MSAIQQQKDYERIAKAMDYLTTHFADQPDLEQVASAMHLSPYHFQRLFSRWAGVSPKKFLQYLSIEYAKGVLARGEGATLADAAAQAGLSGSSRLHDLFITLEGMTPAEYRDGGRDLNIYYDFAPTRYGLALLANTERGLCALVFVDGQEEGVAQLQHRFPNARLARASTDIQQIAIQALHGAKANHLTLHVPGSAFQLKVWEALLRIPSGEAMSYGDLASALGKPKAARAVGSAVARNQVAVLIPCHRVIQASGVLGGYRWHPERKALMLAWEAARRDAMADA